MKAMEDRWHVHVLRWQIVESWSEDQYEEKHIEYGTWHSLIWQDGEDQGKGLVGWTVCTVYVGAKSDQHVNIYSFVVRYDRMWPST